MSNPWLGFRAKDIMIHDRDFDVVQQHNFKFSAKPNYQFQTWMPPEPWVGSLDASVVVLYSNPGATQSDLEGQRQPGFEKIVEYSIANLNQELNEYPHFFLDPDLASTDGGIWFRRRYADLITESSLQTVSQQIVTIELAPYHSKNWKAPSSPIPTQEFTYQILRNAIKDGKVVVAARGRKLWEAAVPELASYQNVVRPNSVQSAYVSRGNYGAGFEKLVRAIREQA